MGRGRAKAKQTKIARGLKYAGPKGDLTRLQAELHAANGSADKEHAPDETETAVDEQP